MDWLDEQIQLIKNREKESIRIKIKELYQQALRETLYEAYTPQGKKHYDRTYQMLNNIDVKIENDDIIVYNNIENMNYQSVVDKRDVTALIPFLLDYTGHMDGTGIYNMYHYYPERHYLERAKELIQEEFPQFKIEIFRNQPPVV